MYTGRRAIVTGASSGIGFALCQRLSHLGYSVTMVARTEHRLAKNLDLLLRSGGQHHLYNVVDLEQLGLHHPENMLKPLFTDASLLVNCAGVTNHNVLTRLSPEAIATTINLNLLAPILLSKSAVMPFLRQQKKTGVVPSILNILSMLSISGVTVPGTSPYAALKAGLLGFTESLAAELNGKIRVNAVLPALVPETEMGKSGSPQLPTVSLQEVIEACEKVITDDEMNGKFVVADGNGFRSLN
ncbi:NAD(P)-binding protein [Metschnikowia bicuspidata var. bicuspidata NRRL YB-4993]|uniref:NAD(P)-binding protein n=1 Tax=Metschnikowia bicuspidata var. bicuspidata NRRL YB-4993 TaxID=869754 RepID=A0A1A0H8E0_9ASCO|nr:NAD(P)-binding protein [Metschnikowia bicuspidata var. bicuspidata NRRL YB-4993]OBA20250.1 NAD(P)-binding protein [Metschnikowia bicuspidata var. bicuspidata NRRL YB-4993]